MISSLKDTGLGSSKVQGATNGYVAYFRGKKRRADLSQVMSSGGAEASAFAMTMSVGTVLPVTLWSGRRHVLSYTGRGRRWGHP